MTAFPTYQIGTVSVSNGSNLVTGSGMVWSSTNARSGDSISINGLPPVLISDVADFTNLTLVLPWEGATQASVPYVIIQNSTQRVSGATSYQGVNDLLTKLESMGLMWYLDPAWSEPSVAKPPLVAPEGQSMLKIDTGQLWVMQGGVWVSAGVYKGLNFKGAWSSATAYVVNDVVSSAGSAYIAIAPSTNQAPPSAAWALLASKGDAATVAVGTVTTGAGGSAAAVTNVGTSGAAVFDFSIPQGKSYAATSTTSLAIGAGSKVFTTQAGLAYTNGARVRASSAASAANYMEGLATYSGTTLTIAVDNFGGSGTHADWNFNVAGDLGVVAGALQVANNLSDVANPATALANIGGLEKASNLSDVANPATAFANLGGMDLSTVVSLTAASTLTSTAFGRLHFITGIAAFTTTIPTPVGNAGKTIAFVVGKPSSATKLYTITTPAGDIGRSGASIIMWANESVLLRSNGTDWEVLESKQIPFVGQLFRTTDVALPTGSPGQYNYTSVTGDPSGLNIPFVGNNFSIPRTGRYIFSLYAYQTGTGSTSNQGWLGGISANQLSGVFSWTGSASAGTVYGTAHISAVAGDLIIPVANINGGGPLLLAASQVPARLDYAEIVPSW